MEGQTRELTKMICSLFPTWTLLLAWRPLEAARYIEALKFYETKSPDVIMPSKKNEDSLSQAVAFLTAIPTINKTDAINLLSHFRVSTLIYKHIVSFILHTMI
jgi:hypothetical protein